MTTLLLIIILLAFISGAELFAVMIGAAALGALSSARGFVVEFDGLIVSVFGGLTDDKAATLSTIPMFIYAGYLLAEAKTADRLVRFANAVLGWMPGGLAIVTILTCALFTTFTGASGVTIVALGGVLMPALVKNGYPKRFSMGLLAGTGSVGLLFPPALPLFVYGTVYGLQLVGDPVAAGEWDNRRFIFAGIVPGILTVGMLALVAVFVARKLPRQKFELGELGRSFVAALPELIIPFGVIALLATGFGSLPEVAALTVLYVVILEVVVLRMLKPAVLWTVSREAMGMVGAIFVIIVASSAFTNYLVTNKVPELLVDWTRQYVDSKLVFLLALNLLLLVVGMIMDIFSAIVIVLPLIVPIARFYGVDPYHLGVIFLLNLEVGYLTPPVGLNLFITSIKFQTPVVDVMRATIPFMLTLLVALGIVTYVPALTVVPPAERREPVNNLVVMVETALEEAKVSIASITLVDAKGTELKDGKGQPITKQFKDCKAIADENERNVCQSLFFEVTACRPDAKSADPKQIACANLAIAKWTVSNMNGDALHPEYAITTMTELPMLDADGKPIEWDEPVMKDGQPVLDPDTNDPKTEKKPLTTADGKPLVKKLASCDEVTGTERDTCRQLFVEASNCYIDPPDVADCIAEKSAECGTAPAEAPMGGAGSAAGSAADAGSGAGSGSAVAAAGSGSAVAAAGSGSAADAGSAAGSGAGSAAAPPAPAGGACAEQAVAACTKQAIAACVADKIASWLEDYPDKAKQE